MVTKTELIWPEKSVGDRKLERAELLKLPFQVIETINETRASREAKKTGIQKTLFNLLDDKEGDTFDEGWKNKLIWGDNKYIMSALLEKFSGKIDLIYIDPPFATGMDFSFTAQIGDNDINITKEQSIIEEKTYRDTWGKGVESYLSMMHDRLTLMHNLLSENGSIYVHLDWHVGHYVKVILDEIFGYENFRNEINVKRIRKNVQEYATVKRLNVANDIILFFSKTDSHRIIQPRRSEKMEDRWHAFDAPDLRTGMDYELFGQKPPIGRHWMWSKDKAELAIKEGRLRPHKKTGRPEYHVESTESVVTTMWDDISAYSFSNGFNTEKSESLLKRIVEMSSKPGDLIADFFCGSGTTPAVAEKLGRRWIGCDLGRYAIHATRKRLMGIENCKPFEILNLGKYERQVWQGVSFNGKDEQTVYYEYLAFILKLYGAEPVAGFSNIHGKKGKALVYIGSVDAPVTIDEILAALRESASAGVKELHILGWEWEMGLHELLEVEAQKEGIKLILKLIPNETMEAEAVRKGDVRFFDLSYLKTDTKINGKKVTVELTDFVIPNTELVPNEVREEIKKWSDYVDYWAVDFNFQNDTFVNQWTSYRTKQDRSLNLKSDLYTYKDPGRYRILVKVIDIFGIDTTQSFEIEVK